MSSLDIDDGVFREDAVSFVSDNSEELGSLSL